MRNPFFFLALAAIGCLLVTACAAPSTNAPTISPSTELAQPRLQFIAFYSPL